MITGGSILERENTPEALGYARAFRRRYNSARLWRRVRVGVAVLLGTGGVLLALLEPSTAEYVSAVAAAWLLFGRVVLEPAERQQRRCGAGAQDLFDTTVFDLPWSDGVVGDRPAPEDVLNWGRNESEDGLRNWYSDTGSSRHPVDVLINQRSILTWARQDHDEHASRLRVVVIGAFVGSVGLALILNLSVGDYLLRLGLPALPALLDVWDIATAHQQAAKAKDRLEKTADRLLTQTIAQERLPTVADCRQLQDGIYGTRLLPGVPNYMYKRNRPERQQNMDEVVAEQVEALPPTLR